MARVQATADQHAEVVSRLCRIPNVGPAMAEDLLRLGIESLEDARGRDPDALYEELCALEGVRHDPCVRDVFAAVLDFAHGAPAQPWWIYSRERKSRTNGRG